MITLTPDVLLRIIPAAGARVHTFCEPINDAMAEFGILSEHEVSSFISEIGHESRFLQCVVENLNYSAQGLANTWARFSTTGKRCGPPTAEAKAIERQPEKIANIVYANRYGNGGPETGDGWKYRGKGLIQITFLGNHAQLQRDTGIPALSDPMVLTRPVEAARSAGWYWKSRGIGKVDDDEDVREETKIINGGDLGLAQRQDIFDRALEVLT